MTDIYIMIFFGVALIVSIYLLWILLRFEMVGRPKSGPDLYDFGFETSSHAQKASLDTRQPTKIHTHEIAQDEMKPVASSSGISQSL